MPQVASLAVPEFSASPAKALFERRVASACELRPHLVAPSSQRSVASHLLRPLFFATRAFIRFAIVFCSAVRLMAQGATGAAVQGTVTRADSTPVADATVLVTNTATGERWQTLTRGKGRFFLEHLSVGGPYRVDVRAIGFEPAERTGILLSLGQRTTIDFGLAPSAFEIEELVVQATPDPRINAGRTGPALTIPEATIVRLPVDGRDFTRLALLSPQVTPSPNGGLSFAGQHDRLNSLQVDGTTDNGVKGLVGEGIYGIPGSQNSFGLFALVPEAVQDLQVVTAPFDVRYGNFAGGW